MADFIDTLTFARVAGVHISTVRRWIRAGKVRAVQPFEGSTWRIPRSEVDRLFGPGMDTDNLTKEQDDEKGS